MCPLYHPCDSSEFLNQIFPKIEDPISTGYCSKPETALDNVLGMDNTNLMLFAKTAPSFVNFTISAYSCTVPDVSICFAEKLGLIKGDFSLFIIITSRIS